MRVQLMYPRNREEGEFFEQVCMFAARRARTMKDHDALWEEASSATSDRLDHFLNYILYEEWSQDVAEFSLFVYDIEQVPSWLMPEFFRHRFIVRDWSFEQRSKRAIHGERISVINPFNRYEPTESDLWQQMEDLIDQSNSLLTEAHRKGIPAEKSRYACLEGTETAVAVAGNARALYELFLKRGSADIGAHGKAAPEFMELADEMFYQAQAMCPRLFASFTS